MKRSERPTETIEDYLQLIYTMRSEGKPIIAARIKERRSVSAPTAWATLKRMERDGLVRLDRNHEIELSPKGQQLAESIIRRHMLAERLLTDILKLEWAEVHDEAHKIEHAISPIVERQILTILNNPQTCPHGNPIPGVPPHVDEVAVANATITVSLLDKSGRQVVVGLPTAELILVRPGS